MQLAVVLEAGAAGADVLVALDIAMSFLNFMRRERLTWRLRALQIARLRYTYQY